MVQVLSTSTLVDSDLLIVVDKVVLGQGKYGF